MTSKLTCKRTFAALAAGVCFFASLSAFAQYNPNIQQNVQPNAFSQTGYTNDGTLFMGGQRIGNPHQVLHDLNVPSFFGVNANRLSFSDVPSYGQGTLAQMENHTLTIGVPAGNVVLSRLYVTPTNPYTQGVATPHNNYQTYQGVVADASAGSYQLTVANDNKLYAFKTLGTMSTQSQNILIKELPAHSVFIANSDPKGGAVAVRVTQSGDYAAMQNYFDTVKPYDFSWRSAFGPYAALSNYSGPVVFGANGNVNGINPYVDPASFYFNWVMGSSQVQSFQNQLNQESRQSGNESFGQLAWDANTNQYVMLRDPNAVGTQNSVSGTFPTLGAGQTGVFGMHTHTNGRQPSGQDLRQAAASGTDQVILGGDGWNYVVIPGGTSTGNRNIDFTFEQWQQILPRVLPYAIPGSAAILGGSKLTQEQKVETARKLNESWTAGWNSFVSWVTGSPSSSNIVQASGPVDAVRGAKEWGRNNGIGADEGKRRFHDIKKGDPLSRADDDYKVDPVTGDVIDPEGEVIGNLNDKY